MASPTVRKVILPGIVFAAFWALGVTFQRSPAAPRDSHGLGAGGPA